MSTIDSGLGWSCDSNFMFSEAQTLVTFPNGNIIKKNPGAAIVAAWHNNGSPTSYGVTMISPDSSTFAELETDSNDIYVGTVTSEVHDDVTWYVCDAWNQTPTYSQNESYHTEKLPLLNTSLGYSGAPNAVVTIINESSFEFTVNNIPTVDYVKAFVEGVEAETATRVNALNTAKQPKTMSAAVSVGGVSQSTVESAIGAMATKISKIDFDIHRNLGTEITAAQKLAIATGTFEDLPIGAYWTLNNTVYRIAHHDYYLGTGDTECTSHHIVVVPDNAIYSAKMNDTGTTTGGYAGSKMRTTNLATALSTFETDFGAAHILNHRILITNAVTNGQASGWTWVDSKVDLMSENMIYGHTAWGQTGFEIGVEKGQLVLFSLYPEFIHERAHQCWLRSIASESGVCYVSDYGDASNGNASRVAGVRPYACIYFDDVLV